MYQGIQNYHVEVNLPIISTLHGLLEDSIFYIDNK